MPALIESWSLWKISSSRRLKVLDISESSLKSTVEEFKKIESSGNGEFNLQANFHNLMRISALTCSRNESKRWCHRWWKCWEPKSERNSRPSSLSSGFGQGFFRQSVPRLWRRPESLPVFSIGERVLCQVSWVPKAKHIPLMKRKPGLKSEEKVWSCLLVKAEFLKIFQSRNLSRTHHHHASINPLQNGRQRVTGGTLAHQSQRNVDKD